MDLKSDIIKRVRSRFRYKGNNIYNFYQHLHSQNKNVEEWLGISFDDYTEYIKNSFNDDCNEKKGFHIDHIKPLQRALTENEYIDFWHYTNTRAESPRRNQEKSDLFEYEYFLFGDSFKNRPIEKIELFNNATKGQKEHIMTMAYSIPQRVEYVARLKLIGEDRLREIREFITEKHGYNSSKKAYNLKFQNDVNDGWYKYGVKSFYKNLNIELRDDEKKFLDYRNKLLKNETITFKQIEDYINEWNRIKNTS